MLLSNKGILPILWELYPNHPNLLAPTAAINSSLFGQITTSDPPRIVQLSLKVDF